MNERIKKLEQQSYIDAPHEMGGTYKAFSKEKFARLIVRECAGIYDKIDNGNAHLGTEDYLEALEKHFQS